MAEDSPPAPTIRVLPAAAAMAWLRGGLRLFVRQPFALGVVVTLGPILMWTVDLLPWIGAPLAIALAPAVNLGMLAACRRVADGATPTAGVYLKPLRDPRTRTELVRLGLAYAAAMTALAAIWSLLGLDQAIRIDPATDQPGIDFSPGLLGSAVLGILLWIPLQMAISFAPVLVAWHRQPAAKAMFFSFFACWRNRASLAAFVALTATLATFITLVVAELLSLLVPQRSLAGVLLAPLPLLLLAIVQAAFYCLVQDLLQTPSPAVEST